MNFDFFAGFEDGGETATRLFLPMFSRDFGRRPGREVLPTQSGTNKQVFRGKQNLLIVELNFLWKIGICIAFANDTKIWKIRIEFAWLEMGATINQTLK